MASIEPIRIQQWEQYPWLRHGFSTRSGGVSTVYGGNTLNLGWTREDDPAAITENRRRFVEAVLPQGRLIGIRQIHGAIVHSITEEGSPHATADGKAILEGDGLVTHLPGVLIAVGTADCVPVLIADTKNRVVAALHAGWRGTAARIVEAGIAKLRQDYGSNPEDLLGAVGPSIGACCYTVGEEVHSQFRTNFPYADSLFHTESESLYLDLWEANRQQLLHSGLKDGQVTVIGACTACSRDASGDRRFFSHRDERGAAGRMLNAIGIAH